RARFVFLPPTTAEQLGHSVTAGLTALRTLAQRPDAGPAQELVRQLGGRFRNSRHGIGEMRQDKMLHDCLHRIAYPLVELLTSAVSLFQKEPDRFGEGKDDRRTLRRYCADVERWTHDAETAAAGPPPIPFFEVEAAWVNNLLASAASIKEALETGNPALAAQGLRLIELVLDQQPTRINSELVSRATRLDLRQLSTELGRGAALLPGAESPTGLFAGGLRDLHELHPRLNSLIAEHGHWQALHNNLAPFHRFPMLRGIMWMKLRDAGREIADLYQTADW